MSSKKTPDCWFEFGAACCFVTGGSYCPGALSFHLALGQQASANINGTIMDASGAIIEGAEITLTNVETSVSRATVSNSTGNYVFVDVPPGTYTMKIVKTGFATASQTQFTLNVNQTATMNFHLTVGSTQQSVTVEATAVAVQASTAELGTVINEQPVNQLPLNGRNFTQLLTLTPGASPVSVGQNNGGGGGFAGNAIGSFSFPALNGQRNRSNMFLLDGINDLGSFIGNYNFGPIVNTVQEFKVQSHNDEAEFGQAVGGIVNVVTKSGTNSLTALFGSFCGMRNWTRATSSCRATILCERISSARPPAAHCGFQRSTTARIGRSSTVAMKDFAKARRLKTCCLRQLRQNWVVISALSRTSSRIRSRRGQTRTIREVTFAIPS